MTKDRNDNFKEKLKGTKDAIKALDKYTDDQIHSTADYEKMLVKSMMLINGGAIVALLAFIGNIWPIEAEQSVFTSLITALEYFLYGLLCSIVGSVGLFGLGVEHALNAFEKHSSSARTAPCVDLRG